MEVIALVGASGTGKSYRAVALAHECGAQVIIDDGLLISGSRVLAGVSAKRQPTRVGAIKTAVFSDDAMALQARAALAEAAPKRILVLATSVEMARLICRRLHLPEPARYLHIEEVASPVQITRALDSRRRHDRHVIPAPTVEVKPRLSGTIMAPLRTLLPLPPAQPHQNRGSHLWVEQTVVRPSFSFLGRFTISPQAMDQIVAAALKPETTVRKAGFAAIETSDIGVTINLPLAVKAGENILAHVRAAQGLVSAAVEQMTALNVLAVNVTVKTLFFSPTADLPEAFGLAREPVLHPAARQQSQSN